MKKWLIVIIIIVALFLAYNLTNFIITKLHKDSGWPEKTFIDYSANRTLVKNGGACVFAIDYATTCKFTTADNCSDSFNPGLLCTAASLGTNCGITSANITLENKTYFIDSCLNQANPYDITQLENQSYWTHSLI
jgi:hypothetical protein